MAFFRVADRSALESAWPSTGDRSHLHRDHRTLHNGHTEYIQHKTVSLQMETYPQSYLLIQLNNPNNSHRMLHSTSRVVDTHRYFCVPLQQSTPVLTTPLAAHEVQQEPPTSIHTIGPPCPALPAQVGRADHSSPTPFVPSTTPLASRFALAVTLIRSNRSLYFCICVAYHISAVDDLKPVSAKSRSWAGPTCFSLSALRTLISSSSSRTFRLRPSD